jgi:hypothetical protein
MSSLVALGVAGLAVVVFLAILYGRKQKQLDQCKKAIKTYENYQDIDNQPDVDDPFKRMLEK